MATTRDEPADLAVAWHDDPGLGSAAGGGQGTPAVAAPMVSIATAHDIAVRRHQEELAALLATSRWDGPMPTTAMAGIAGIMAPPYPANGA